MGTNKFFEDKIVVGLGNPGAKYEDTLHNVGFMVLDNFFVPTPDLWQTEKQFHSLVARYNGSIFVKPQTYMNDSGKAISKILNYYKKSPEQLVVVHDDVDLDFGVIKLVKNSGTAGHHGIEDTSAKLGTLDFYRIRIGIGRPQNHNFDVHDYVLSTLSLERRQELFKNFELFLKTV
jgi:PTH1 family peptidyl-tRNA hydrolase